MPTGPSTSTERLVKPFKATTRSLNSQPNSCTKTLSFMVPKNTWTTTFFVTTWNLTCSLLSPKNATLAVFPTQKCSRFSGRKSAALMQNASRTRQQFHLTSIMPFANNKRPAPSISPTVSPSASPPPTMPVTPPHALGAPLSSNQKSSFFIATKDAPNATSSMSLTT